MNIYVGNLALGTTADELRQAFIAFGQVLSVNIRSDSSIGSGRGRGYGFVEMSSKSEGETAVISLRGRMLRGRVIEVIAALPLSDKSTGSLDGGSRFRKRRQRRYNNPLSQLPATTDV